MVSSVVQSMELGRQAARQREEDAYTRARRPIENAFSDQKSQLGLDTGRQNMAESAARERRAVAEQDFIDQGRKFARAAQFSETIAGHLERNPEAKPSDIMRQAPPDVLKIVGLDTPEAQQHFAEIYDTNPGQLRVDAQMYGGGKKVKSSEPVESDEGVKGFLQMFEDGSTHFVPGYKSTKSATGSFTIAGKRFDAAGNLITDESDALAELERGKALSRTVGKAEGTNLAEDLPWSQADVNKARDAIGNKAERLTNMSDAIDRAVNMADDLSAGAGAATKAVPGSPAANLAAQLNTIGSIVGLDELQRLRDNSKTGGALGQVTEAEHKLLQSVIASIDQSQSPSILRRQLKEVRDKAKASWDRVQAAYERDLAQFGGGKATAAPKRLKYNAETGALE